jgi:hypothetical protein
MDLIQKTDNMDYRKIILAALLAACSCSIREEREGCPCILTITSDRESVWHYTIPPEESVYRQGIPYPVNLKISMGGYIAYDNPGAFPSTQEEEKIEIVKGQALVTYHTTLVNAVENRDGITIAKGQQWDRLFIGRDKVFCEGETARDTLHFRKEHCIIWLHMAGMPAGDGCPFSSLITGNVIGIEPETLSPVKGEFQCIPERLETFVFQAVVPRQTDDSLSLELTDDSGRTHTYDIGKSIADAGYDWGKEDLDNLTLTVEYGIPGISVTVLPWEEYPVPDMTL